MKRLLILPLLYIHSLIASEPLEKKIVVVIPSYNNHQWLEKNLDSIIHQDYENYRIIYINDASSDGTGAEVEAFVRQNSGRSFRAIQFDDGLSEDIVQTVENFKEEVNRERAFFTLINNKNRCGTMANQYRAYHSCDDDEIASTLDGDDWVIDDAVLKRINRVYCSGDVWMTHGTLIEYPHMVQAWSEPVPADIVASNRGRQFKCPTHMRTFYAWLFKKIALEDFLYQGKFFVMTGDMAIMFPILEMAAERHRFIDEPIYMYNMVNPINDNRVNADLQNEMDRYIRNMSPYQRLEGPN